MFFVRETRGRSFLPLIPTPLDLLVFFHHFYNLVEFGIDLELAFSRILHYWLFCKVLGCVFFVFCFFFVVVL